jgi:hypothetical protein
MQTRLTRRQALKVAGAAAASYGLGLAGASRRSPWARRAS